MTQTAGSVAAVRVDLRDHAYDILIGENLLPSAGAFLSGVLPSRKLCVVTDETVAKLYLVDFMRCLEHGGFRAYPPVILPPGEDTKSFASLQSVIDRFLGYGLDRSSAIVALGGGVIGDLAGFAAAIVMRGVPFVQVPTTLLSQVDSSVGGKTAINIPRGKNLVGAFHQPVIVLADTATLRTLPEREMKAGYAEMLKYALIGDPAFFAWLEERGRDVLAGRKEALIHAIGVSCRSKAAIVADDEKEQKDIRALLNLGHTFGHALEALGGYDGRLLHGEAVGIGMSLAFGMSHRLGLCPESDVRRVQEHLDRMGLAQRPPFAVTAQGMLDRMRGDKKNRDGHIALILVRGIGRAFVEKNVSEGVLRDFLEERFG